MAVAVAVEAINLGFSLVQVAWVAVGMPALLDCRTQVVAAVAARVVMAVMAVQVLLLLDIRALTLLQVT